MNNLMQRQSSTSGIGVSVAPARRTLSRMSLERGIYWSLRLAVGACFIGHGAFGIITNADWLPYFAVAHIPEWLAWQLERPIGAMDITMGIITLVSPRRGVLAWAVFWGFWTALLRPLAGQGVWELLERAGNFAVPMAMLYMTGSGHSFSDWWRVKALPRAVEALNTKQLAWLLRVATATLLVGHGGFGVVMQKQAWIGYFGAVGIGADVVQSAQLIPLVGWFEIVLAIVVLVKPARGLLLGVFAWKLGTELLRLPAGEPIWEVLERGGSFGAPLALLFLTQWRIQHRQAEVEIRASERVDLLPPQMARAA